tara:strand:- start:21756 stop:22349 length:594 start_codon:yes stop_codon:yes gene_type:complete
LFGLGIYMSIVQDLLNSRRSIYHFTDQNVKLTDLDKAFKAASNAPCHKQTHPWNYYVLGEKTRKKLLPTVISLAKIKAKNNNEEDTMSSVNRAISKIMDIPVIIVVTAKLSPEDLFREQEDYAATVCSLHNLVLSLWDMGIGSQWSTGGITRSSMTYDRLEINIKLEKIIGFLKVGYPQKIPKKQKKEVSEIRKFLP